MRIFSIIFMLFFTQVSLAATATNIADSAEQVAPLLPGLQLPNTEIKTSEGKPSTLYDLLDNKTTILVFYRGGWCPYCTRQLASLKKIESQLSELNAQILAISPDSPDTLAKNPIQAEGYTLLSDDKMALTQAMGLAFYLDDKTAQVYRNKLGVNFVGLDGKEKVALPVPAVYVVNKSGQIQFQYVNPNFKVRLSESLLITAVNDANQTK